MANKTSMQEEIHYNCRGLLLLPIEATTSFKGKVHGQFIYYISVCNRLFLVANTSVFLGFSSMIMIPSTNSPSYSFHKISLLHGLSLKTPSNIEHELIMPLKFHVPLLNSVVKSRSAFPTLNLNFKKNARDQVTIRAGIGKYLWELKAEDILCD